MTTTVHRQRLEQIRERTRTARTRRNTARKQLDVAREVGDTDAQAVAQIGLDMVNEEIELTERLDNQLLSSISGLDGGRPACGSRSSRSDLSSDPKRGAAASRQSGARRNFRTPRFCAVLRLEVRSPEPYVPSLPMSARGAGVCLNE